MQSFILKNGKIFDGNSFIENDIIVENGWVVHVGKVKDINFVVLCSDTIYTTNPLQDSCWIPRQIIIDYYV